MGKSIGNWLQNTFGVLKPPSLTVTDVLEIIILAVIIYYVLGWVKNTRAWVLLKGFAVLLLFTLTARILKMDTIYWLTEKILGLGITALLVVFQPELRKGLEELGTKRFF